MKSQLREITTITRNTARHKGIVWDIVTIMKNKVANARYEAALHDIKSQLQKVSCNRKIKIQSLICEKYGHS